MSEIRSHIGYVMQELHNEYRINVHIGAGENEGRENVKITIDQRALISDSRPYMHELLQNLTIAMEDKHVVVHKRSRENGVTEIVFHIYKKNPKKDDRDKNVVRQHYKKDDKDKRSRSPRRRPEEERSKRSTASSSKSQSVKCAHSTSASMDSAVQRSFNTMDDDNNSACLDLAVPRSFKRLTFKNLSPFEGDYEAASDFFEVFNGFTTIIATQFVENIKDTLVSSMTARKDLIDFIAEAKFNDDKIGISSDLDESISNNWRKLREATKLHNHKMNFNRNAFTDFFGIPGRRLYLNMSDRCLINEKILKA